MSHFSAPLLGIPQDIRARILREAGLIRERSISLYPNFLHATPNSVEKSYYCDLRNAVKRPSASYISFPMTLFLTCSKLHLEGREIFYGENPLHLNYGDHDAVLKLRHFPPSIWASIRTLNVCYGSPPQPHCSYSIMALKSLSETLAQGLKPYQVTIIFSLYAKSVTDACLLLAQLRNLPSMKSVKLQINGMREKLDGVSLDWATGREVRKDQQVRMAIEAFGQKITQAPPARFPFSRLPLELQRMIISHVIPIAESRKRGGVPISTGLKGIGWCCGKCYDILGHGMNYPERICRCNRGLYYSSSCTCNDHLKNGLFATSKGVREEAIKIAYGENDFLIPHSPYSSIARTTEQISSIPSNRLQWVTRLTIELDGLPREGISDLITLLRLVRQSCKHPKFFLRLRLTSYFADQAAYIQQLYETVIQLKFGNSAILLLSPPNPCAPYDVGDQNFVPVLGRGATRSVDEIVGQGMRKGWRD